MRIIDELSAYLLLVRYAFRKKTQYRVDFIVGAISTIVYNAFTLLSIRFIVARFPSLGGWNVWEMWFLYSFFLICHGVYTMFTAHIHQVESMIVQGSMDAYFMRPVGVLTQVLGGEFNENGIINLLIGVVGAAASIIALDIHWRAAQWIFFFAALVSGIVIEFSISWVLSCISFWHPNVRSPLGVFGQLIGITQRYPISIFDKGFAMLLTWAIPVAFINYYPCLYLLNKSIAHSWLRLISPGIAITLLFVGMVIWRKALRNYTGTGS